MLEAVGMTQILEAKDPEKGIFTREALEEIRQGSPKMLLGWGRFVFRNIRAGWSLKAFVSRNGYPELNQSNGAGEARNNL